MILFLMGMVWFFMISMQTRIISHASNYWLHGCWTFSVSIVWAYMIKGVMFSESNYDLIMYATGTAVGSVAATFIHAKLKARNEPGK